MYPTIRGGRRIRKLGNTMWAETEEGLMKPQELEGISEHDLRSLDKLHNTITMYRKVPPVLEALVNSHWDDIAKIKPFLRDTLAPRSGARVMMASGTWDTFWNTLN